MVKIVRFAVESSNLTLKKMNAISWGWIKKTLRGYTVSFVNKDTTYTMHHRPFRPPGMHSEKNPKGLSGKKYEMIYYDEVEEWPL